MKKAVLSILLAASVIAGLCAFPHFAAYFSERWSRLEHAQVIERAFNDLLLPASAFVRDFTAREHRLPTDAEFEQLNHGKTGWDIVSIYRERPQWFTSWGVPGADFVVTTNVPEWNLYYCSWDNKIIEGWTD